MEEKLKQNYLILIFAFILTIIYILISIFSGMTNVECKNYIINHRNEIVKINDNNYEIRNIKDNYYTDITITLLDENSCSVVFWGNKKSFLWKVNSDKIFTIDVNYEDYKKRDITKDLLILLIIKNKQCK